MYHLVESISILAASCLPIPSNPQVFILSSFDAVDLEKFLIFGDESLSSASHIVRSRTELDSIPSDVKDLWIGRFDTSEWIILSTATIVAVTGDR